MARRFELVMAALALMVGMGASTVGVATVAAQTGRTSPPAVDLTCHGYDEGATRAYNCIPEPSQQHHMRTFVPPVGSACDAGSIAEFPAGRIVFQIRCRDGSRGQTAAWSHWGWGPASFDMPADASARFWVHTAFSGSSAHFVVRCRAPQERVVVNELLGASWGNTGTNGIYGMAGCREVEVDTGGQDLQWWFTQELTATASMPPQSWEQVTGAGGALSTQALQDLARAVDLERLWGPQATWGIDLGSANARVALRTFDVVAGSGHVGIASGSPDDRTYALDRAPDRSAITRTRPLTLDLTCHGYVEAAGTRAYNCIPEPSQQHHMRTFVPPVGSACDAGSIAEFPAGRIVFQIRCRDDDARPDGSNRAPVSIKSIPDRTLKVGETWRIRIREYFEDPDGDPLHQVTVGHGDEVEVEFISDGIEIVAIDIVAVGGEWEGWSQMRITVADPGDLEARQEFNVRVTSDDGPPPRTDGGACRVQQVLSPGDSCTVDVPFIIGQHNRFEVQADGSACWGGGFCAGTGLNLNGFEAHRISGTDDWYIEALP